MRQHDQQNPPTSASSSSSSRSRNPTEPEDLTWLDFLRTAGNTVPASARPPPLDRSYSADRKRRHAGSEPERRDYPYPPMQRRFADARSGRDDVAGGVMGQPGENREMAIDLTSSPRVSQISILQPSDASSTGNRRQSDVLLPKWQPDTEVNRCPVCGQDFSFWYRKHHCRKCGRVVCSNCSPHRITIPRQYIVQPPSLYSEDEASPITPPGARGNLGGGEIVRVCNPCVPDPWTPGTRTGSADSSTPISAAVDVSSRAQNHARTRVSQPVPALPEPNLRNAGDRDRPERYRFMSAGGPGRTRSNTLQPLPTSSRDPRLSASITSASSYGRSIQDGSSPHLSTVYSHRHSRSNTDRPTPQRTSHTIGLPPSLPRPVHAASVTPRRQVREEDECPVCGVEMPPGDTVREAHIQECISSRFSSTPNQSHRLSATTQQAVISPIGGSTGLLASSAPHPPIVPEGSRPRAPSYRSRGMALYKATEKDCTTEDGDPQECVICFEEFQPGDDMGRMECLCKFHRVCIRQWWDTKGTGSCPTHQLHDT